MKKLLILLLGAGTAFGAAKDVKLTQRNAADTKFVETTLTPSANSFLGFDSSSNAAIKTIGTVNGHSLDSNVTISASDVGLGNVTNTSDANKPVSTAQQTALDAKANAANGTHTGTTTIARADVTKLNFASSDLGTVAGGGNITLTNTNTIYRVICSGSTATVVLPSSPPDGRWIIEGNSTYAGGRQVINVPSMIRPEQDPDSPQTSFGIAASSNSYWTAVITSTGGVFVKFSVDGDDLATGGTDPNALHTNASGEIAGLSAKASPTTSDVIPIEDAADSNNKKSATLGSLPVSTAAQAAIDAKVVSGVYGAPWSSDTSHAPSRKDVYDKFESLGSSAFFVTGMSILWPTDLLGSKPVDWIEAGTGGTPAGAAVGGYSVIVKADGTVAEPVFSPVAGTYPSSQNVSITTTTSGATVMFTTDGSPPSRTNGTSYSTPVPVSADTTLKAMAYKDYSGDSTTLSGDYIISAPSLAVTGASVASDGNSISVDFSESVSIGAGGNGGLGATMSAGSSGTSPTPVTLTYSSGAPGTTLVFTASRPINKSAVETLTLAYTQPGDGIEATTGGADLAAFSGQDVTNSSTAQTYTLQETLGSSSTNLSIGDASTNQYVASKSTASGTYVLTRMDINLLKVGSPTGVLTGTVYADNSGAPGSVLASSTNTKTAADLLTTESFIPFLFNGQTVNSSSVYWYGAYSSAYNNVNYYRVRVGGLSSGQGNASSDGLTWSSYNSRAFNIKNYSSP